MSLPYLWRISKYDPAKRTPDGKFLGDEWTHFAQIGRVINGCMLTYADYFAVERKYVDAILFFLDEAGVDALTVTEMSAHFQNRIKSGDMFRDISITPVALAAGEIAEGSILSRDRWADVIRLNLREALWCKLDAPQGFQLRFGWDYYVYIGSSKAAPRSEERTAALGLFAEAGVFPAKYV